MDPELDSLLVESKLESPLGGVLESESLTWN